MSAFLRTIAILIALISLSVQAHDLHHEVTDGQAIVVHLFFMDNSPFAYENYELYREGDVLPYQTGRTDARGYFSFIPDSAGSWQVKAFSADGHGVTFEVTTNEDMTLSYAEKPLVDRYGRIVIGVAVLFGIFGLLSLMLKRRKKNA